MDLDDNLVEKSTESDFYELVKKAVKANRCYINDSSEYLSDYETESDDEDSIYI